MSRLIIRNGTEYASKRLDHHIVSVKRQSVTGVKPVLQRSFEVGNNCVLSSFTTVLHWITGENPHTIYQSILKSIQPKWAYSRKVYGTLPFFVNRIGNQAIHSLGLSTKCKTRIIKGCKFNWKTVKDYINYGLPLILCCLDSNHGYYRWHAVVVVGYMEFLNRDGESVRLLKVYDNWTTEDRYIDFDTLSGVSMISRIK